jgi:hypothetical protein
MRWNGRGEVVRPLRGQSLESRLAAQRSVSQAIAMKLVALCLFSLGFMALSLGLSSLVLHILFETPFSWSGAAKVSLLALVAVAATIRPLGYGGAEFLEYSFLFAGLAGARVALSVLTSIALRDMSMSHWLIVAGGAAACWAGVWYIEPKRRQARRERHAG